MQLYGYGGKKKTIPHGYQKPENEKEQLRKPTVELKQFSKIKYDRYEQTTNMIASVLWQTLKEVSVFEGDILSW